MTRAQRRLVDLFVSQGWDAARGRTSSSEYLEGYAAGESTAFFLAAVWLLEDLGAEEEARALRWFTSTVAPRCPATGEPTDECDHVELGEVQLS
ncbi:MAG: hypothetical protein ABI629_21060 [bacterium]